MQRKTCFAKGDAIARSGIGTFVTPQKNARTRGCFPDITVVAEEGAATS
jgi:hypothetical protein